MSERHDDPLDALLDELREHPGRIHAWNQMIEKAMTGRKPRPERVAKAAMDMALDDLRHVFDQLIEGHVIHWGPSDDTELQPLDGETVIKIPLGGLAGENLLAQCLELVNEDEELAKKIYEAVTTHRLEHDLAGDHLTDESHDLEINMIVPVDSPLALKFGKVAP